MTPTLLRIPATARGANLHVHLCDALGFLPGTGMPDWTDETDITRPLVIPLHRSAGQSIVRRWLAVGERCSRRDGEDNSRCDGTIYAHSLSTEGGSHPCSRCNGTGWLRVPGIVAWMRDVEVGGPLSVEHTVAVIAWSAKSVLAGGPVLRGVMGAWVGEARMKGARIEGSTRTAIAGYDTSAKGGFLTTHDRVRILDGGPLLDVVWRGQTGGLPTEGSYNPIGWSLDYGRGGGAKGPETGAAGRDLADEALLADHWGLFDENGTLTLPALPEVTS